MGCAGESGQSGRYAAEDAPSAQLQYLQDNALRSGVTTTASGLQYEILRGGTGPSPELGSTVTVHYLGTLIDGTEFDSSYSRNQPAGSHYRFVIPANLAYGDRGAGSQIKPGDTLIFSIELLSFE